MVKKLLVLMAASAIVSVVCFTVLGMMGGFEAVNRGPWGNWGPWADWRGDGNPGPQSTRDLAYSGGPRLNIYYPAEITYTQGPTAKFTVTGPQRLLDQLRLEDGELTLDGGPRYRWNRRGGGRLRIDIVSPDTHEFHLAGAEKMTLRGYDQDELRIYGSGAVDVDGQGKARRLDVSISGAGHLNLENLPVDDARVSISGAGDASLDARKSSDVTISGAGHVQLKCRPQAREYSRSGIGSIDYGPDCASEAAPPASSAPPAAPAAPASKTKV